MTYISIDIDLDDHKDEFLESLTDNELIEECEERDIEIQYSDDPFSPVDARESIKKLICDDVGLNYLTNDATILKELTKMFS